MQQLKIIIKYVEDDRRKPWYIFNRRDDGLRGGFIEHLYDCDNIQNFLKINAHDPNHNKGQELSRDLFCSIPITGEP